MDEVVVVGEEEKLVVEDAEQQLVFHQMQHLLPPPLLRMKLPLHGPIRRLPTTLRLLIEKQRISMASMVLNLTRKPLLLRYQFGDKLLLLNNLLRLSRKLHQQMEMALLLKDLRSPLRHHRENPASLMVHDHGLRLSNQKLPHLPPNQHLCQNPLQYQHHHNNKLLPPSKLVPVHLHMIKISPKNQPKQFMIHSPLLKNLQNQKFNFLNLSCLIFRLWYRKNNPLLLLLLHLQSH
jgi:hypothetical protein